MYVRDRYAIARTPTESMKIKREYTSPSEVKDALECRTAATRHDAMGVFSSLVDPLKFKDRFYFIFVDGYFFNKLTSVRFKLLVLL